MAEKQNKKKQKCVRLNQSDIELIRSAYNHYVQRCGITTHDGSVFSENDWIAKTLRIGANREFKRPIRNVSDE